MSDIKHLKYCVRLGNTCVQDKLEQIQQGTYIEKEVKNIETQNYNEMSFRDRLKNWNT